MACTDKVKLGKIQKLKLEKIPGLRRVTLNFNVDIGDKGAQEFAEALRDDVCLRGMYVHVG